MQLSGLEVLTTGYSAILALTFNDSTKQNMLQLLIYDLFTINGQSVSVFYKVINLNGCTVMVERAHFDWKITWLGGLQWILEGSHWVDFIE